MLVHVFFLEVRLLVGVMVVHVFFLEAELLEG